jgi:hypothetical protein
MGYTNILTDSDDPIPCTFADIFYTFPSSGELEIPACFEGAAMDAGLAFNA